MVVSLLIGIAIVAVVLIVSRLLFQWMETRQERLVEGRLQSLLDLSKDVAPQTLRESFDWRTAVQRSVDQAKHARSYCTAAVVSTSSDSSEPLSGGSTIQWQADIVSPDRWHVRQQAFGDPEEGIDHDEWITIGKSNFQNAGLWHSLSGRNDETNHQLLIGDCIEILEAHTPTLHEVLKVRGKRYLVLFFSDESWDHVDENEVWFEKGFQGRRQLQMWIDPETYHFVKQLWVVDSTDEDGKPAHLEINRVFTSYNVPIEIKPPPWLNVDEAGTIVSADIPVVPFHR